jgi:hypothetical protein
VDGRHPDVGDPNVRSRRFHDGQQLASIPGASHDLEAGALKQLRQTFPEQHRVVGERYPHGRFTLIRVPWPGGLSATSTSTPSEDWSILTVISDAHECFAAFASASATT